MKQLSQIRKDLHDVSCHDRKEHHKTRKWIAKAHSEITENLDFKIDDLRKALFNGSVAARVSKRTVHFVGQGRDTILIPLLLMKDYVHAAILDIISYRADQVSLEDLYFMESEFENLVSSATQEYAALSRGSTAASFDQWVYSCETNKACRTVFQQRTVLPEKTCGATNRTEFKGPAYDGMVKRKRLLPGHKCFSFGSLAGKLLIQVPRQYNHPEHGQKLDEAKLFFIPSKGICSTSVATSFARLTQQGTEPKLCVQVNAFRIVEKASKHWELCSHGTVEEVDNAFRNGVISPYEVNDIGANVSLFVRYCLSVL